MNPTYHLGTEVAVTLIVVVYFQLRVSGLRSDLDEHIKKYEADKQEMSGAINNLYEQMRMMQQQFQHSIRGNMMPQEQQYAYPPTARAPQQPQLPPNPQGNPNPYQGPPPSRQQAPRPQSPPPRGSRDEFMASQRMSPQAGHQGPPPRQIPGMPQNVQSPPAMSQQQYDRDDDNGPSAYGTLGDDDTEMYTGGKKGGLKSMAAMFEQERNSQIKSIAREGEY